MSAPRPLRPRRIAFIVAIAIAATGVKAGRADWIADGVPLCTAERGQNQVAIAADGAHGAIVAWADRRFKDDFDDDVYAQRVDSAGVARWTPDGVIVTDAANAQGQPAIAPFAGGAVIVWKDGRVANGSDDIYAQRVDANGAKLWAPDGVPLGTSLGIDTAPQIISDASSGVLGPVGWNVLWLRLPAGGGTELRMQHVDQTGAGLWTPASAGGVLVAIGGDNGGITGPAMVGDGVGTIHSPKGAVVAWAHRDVVNGYNIRAQRVGSAGSPLWAGTGVLVCGQPGIQTNPGLANVGGGNVVVAWDDARTTNVDLYAQRLNSSGVEQWAGDGVLVSGAQGAQRSPKALSDGAGGAFVVWEDDRSSPTKIYAQRLDGNGQRLWSVDGVPVCIAPGLQERPKITSDGAGGLIVAWEDSRGTSVDLYAQRLNPAGDRVWSPAGVPLTRAGGEQDFVAILSDGQSGVLAAWEDLRSPVSGTTNNDIYANRILASGQVVGVATAGPTRRAGLALVSSNPSRGDVRLRLELPNAAVVRAEVLDVQGRRVRVLAEESLLEAGSHPITWDGADDGGAPVPAGVFFVRVRAGAETLLARAVRLHGG